MNENEAKQVLRDAVDNIKSLIAQEKWKDAHRACLEILRFDPENIKVIRLKNKIEKAVRKINRGSIEQDLRNLEPLFKEGKYEELLEYLKNLQPYAIDFPKITKLTIKTQKAYKKSLLRQQDAYVLAEIGEIRNLADQAKYADALKRAEKLKQVELHLEEIKELIKSIKKRYIDNEIHRNAALIRSEKYEDILLMYQGLLLIDGKSQHVIDQIAATKKKYQVYKVQQKRELIYKMLEKIKTLYQLGRFELAVEMSEEILEADPANKEAKFYLVKSEKKAEKVMDREILMQMRSARRQMKAEMKKNRGNFIRI